ncbi:MAG: hydrogenase maturation protease [Candidatus Omnitrophota bacterium]
MSKTVILGLGNILLKDEGIGCHVIDEILKHNLPPYVEVIDGGTSDVWALMPAGKVRKLIIIDAVKANGFPGSVYRLTPEDIVSGQTGILSLHQYGIGQLIAYLNAEESAPEMAVIIGVEPKDVSWGLSPTPEVAARIRDIIDLILNELE